MIHIKNSMKVLTSIFTLFLFAFISTSTSHANEISSEEKRNIKVTITNNETGETRVIDSVESKIPKEKNVDAQIHSIQNLNDNSIVESLEVFIPLETDEDKENSNNINPLDSSGGSKTGGGITAKVNVNYNIDSSGEKIKFTKVWGSWTPNSKLYYLTDRKVNAHSGSIWGKSLAKTPTSNSFSYNTGFGYNYFAGGDASPRAWTSAISRVSGMTATYTIKMDLAFP